MAYELFIGLHVTNEAIYKQYREAMRPILEAHGGGFRYDFRVSEVLKTHSEHDINRVIVIYFRDKTARESFFTNEAYREIRKQYYDKAVSGSTTIGVFETPEDV